MKFVSSKDLAPKEEKVGQGKRRFVLEECRKIPRGKYLSTNTLTDKLMERFSFKNHRAARSVIHNYEQLYGKMFTLIKIDGMKSKVIAWTEDLGGMGMTTLLGAALGYEKAGLSVIPLLPREKKPYFSWAEFQERRASPAEIVKWWETLPGANIGIVTGSISGIVVIDVDNASKLSLLYPYMPNDKPYNEWIPVVSTGKGMHLYFRYPLYPITNHAGIFPQIDIRATGGYVVAPPSVHPNGEHYQWLTLMPFDPPALPEGLLKLLTGGSDLSKIPTPRSYPTYTTEVPSNTVEGLKYTVKQMSSGNWNCQCERNRTYKKNCSHIDVAKALRFKVL